MTVNHEGNDTMNEVPQKRPFSEQFKIVCDCDQETELKPSPKYKRGWHYCPKCARYVKIVRR